MNRPTLPGIAVVLLACLAASGPAQENLPPLDKLPPVVEAQPVPVPAPACAPSCQGVKILWLEREEPIQVLTPREVIAEERRPALAVDFREEKRTVTEIVVKSRAITREVPFTTMKPVVETCPTTGECRTVMKPCTEMRVQKETVFYPVTEERVIVVRVPFVKEVEEVVPRRTILLEYRTEMQKRPSAIAVPTHEPQDRWLLAPSACPHP